MPLAINSRGNLCREIPRGQYFAAALSFAVAALVLGVWITRDAGPSAIVPGWFPYFGLMLSAAGAAGFLWLALRGQPLEIDTDREALVRGSRVVARLAQIAHVEILEVRAENHEYWRVRLRLDSGRTIDFGVQSSQVDASMTAARIATVIDRPVEVVRR
ncbi:MAG TPA: hypothetical protein VHB46_03055 [Burkholderiales bacterium]|nr:hypothetical protein [Burkholderiales bacterium]